MNNCDVIVTYCWNRVGYNIIRSLCLHGLRVVVGDTSKSNICSRSKYSKGNFIYADPFTDEEKFIEDLKKAVETYRPKVLVPTHDEALVIARHIDKMPQDTIYAMESYEMQYRLSDKLQSTKIAQAAGVPTPRILTRQQVSSYPVVVKTKFGNSAKGVFFPKNMEELDSLLNGLSPDDILIEEFFAGRDYSVDCVRSDSFFCATSYKSLVTKTHGGGTTTQRELVSMPILEEYARKILDASCYKGVCGIDFKVNETTGEAVFIEVNTRYTGGLATPIAAGFDIPYIHYKLVTEREYKEPITPVIGTRTKWILGDLIALVTKVVERTLTKDELRRILSFKFDAFDDFDKNDKRAILGELSYYLNKLLKNRKLNP